MGEQPRTWQEKQAAQPDPIACALTAFYGLELAPPYWMPKSREHMEAAIIAYERAEALQCQCDEPGCDRRADCGWPTEGGYRRTCGQHCTVL